MKIEEKTMHKILGSLLLSLNFLVAGSITATVNTTKVVAGKSLMLTIAVTGEDSSEIPDIPEIDGQKVFNIQRHPNFNVVHVDGKNRMEKTELLVLELRPKSDMIIPSFTANVDGKLEKTEPIKITLVKAETGLKGKTKDFSLDMKIEKNKFYLGESIIVTIYFKQRTNLNLLKVEYTPPKFKDFFSKQIGKGKTYHKEEFTIQELNYLLIAKKSGKLTLESASVKIAERSRQLQKGGWSLDVPKWTELSSSPLSFEVMKTSKDYDLIGKYSLSDKIDQLKVEANKPVNLSISLVGNGSLDDYAGINFDIPSVTIYGDDAKIKSKLIKKKLESDYQKSFVFISDHDFTIPSKEISVFDPATGKINLLKTKEYHIEVEANGKAINKSNVQTQTSIKITKSSMNTRGLWYQKLPSLLVLLLAFLLGSFVTLLLKYISDFGLPKWFKKRKSFNGEDALKILYPKIGESKAVEDMVRKLYAIKCGDKNVEIDKKRLKFLVEHYK